jgi:hypothetical protein
MLASAARETGPALGHAPAEASLRRPTAQGHENENDGGPGRSGLPINEAVSRSQNLGWKPERATVRTGAGYGNLE